MNNYSLCSTPANYSAIEICVDTKPGGIGSQWIRSLKEGMSANCMGPLGNFILKRDSPYPTKVFLATGTGVSPVRSMILSLAEAKYQGNVYLFFGVRSEEDIFWRGEFEELVRLNSFFKYFVVLSQPPVQWEAERGYVQSVLEEKLLKRWNSQETSEAEFYLCGNSLMIEEASEVVSRYGVLPAAIHFERFYTVPSNQNL